MVDLLGERERKKHKETSIEPGTVAAYERAPRPIDKLPLRLRSTARRYGRYFAGKCDFSAVSLARKRLPSRKGELAVVAEAICQRHFRASERMRTLGSAREREPGS
jgi:hypothetical protein